MPDHNVVIVGAGLAGLCCALRLQQDGISVSVLEATDGVGGRVRTDKVNGFLLDRGFQVLLTAYPEAKRVLDYPALNLKPFLPGAMVRFGGGFHVAADPWRRQLDAVKGIFNPVGDLPDKLRIATLRREALRGTPEEIFSRPESTTLQALQDMGFSRAMIDRFFRPFIGGVFFDRDLGTSSRTFLFGFRMFAQGDAALPSKGMGAIPEQLASRLSPGTVRTHARAQSLTEQGARIHSGEEVIASAVVLATEGPETARLLGRPDPGSLSTTTIYFDADQPPVARAWLVLNGEGKGPVNSLCTPSLVAPTYAPQGHSLVAVTVVGNPPVEDEQLQISVRTQLEEWFGPETRQWGHLRTYRIRHALPLQLPPVAIPTVQGARMTSRLFVCGEYGTLPSLQWAMVSGRCAAEAVIQSVRS
jgi:phytoene dehydrogenase-like protein